MEENVLTKIFFIIVGVLFLLFFLKHLMQPMIIVESDNNIITSMPAQSHFPFSTRFIHSVQKTPVEEYFEVNDECNGFILISTRYQSFGVGLPFLASDGTFKREGDSFIMENMNRRIDVLNLRPGISTELALNINDENILLYKEVPLGALVSISIMPRYKFFVMR